MPAPPALKGLRIERGVVLAVALVVVCLIALRSTFGVSFYDDSHYVTVCLRMSQGARPFADEMSVQSLGFLPATAFVWVYTHLAGTTGLVTAFRLFYVALATGVGYFTYSRLRETFHPLVAALAVALPLLCPPFNSAFWSRPRSAIKPGCTGGRSPRSAADSRSSSGRSRIRRWSSRRLP
jgi:hypothetical protein